MQSKNADAEKDERSKEILEVARSRFEQAVEAERELRDLMRDDLKFGAGDQWDEQDKQARAKQRRPCLTINRLPQFIRQIVNDQKQNRPSIKVSPLDKKADIETAKVFQGLIRHIESISDADIAMDTAFAYAVRTGRGYFRIRTQYENPTSFDLEIRIDAISNPDSVYLDPNHRSPDGSDADWGFIFDDIPMDEYKRDYPDSSVSKMDDWSSLSDSAAKWITKDTVRVAEYFYKEYRDVTLAKMSDGSVIVLEDVSDGDLSQILDQGLSVVDKRKSRVPAVKWCKINGVDILEETVWAGQWIPIIPVLGDQLEVEGKRILEGVIRHAKDSQRIHNYYKSAEAETIAQTPRSPWIIAEGQNEGYEDMWATANTQAYSALIYKPTTIGGQLVSPPQRNVYEPPIQALSQAAMMASEDMKATTGIYDASLGAQSNEKSGIAIQRRNNQAQTSNFHFVDNLSRAQKHCGRQLIDLIPKVWDTEMAIRVLAEDDSEEIIWLNKLFERKGKQVQYDLGVGKYDVAISIGPSFETKRQEAASSMLDLSKASPQVMNVASDLIVKNMDWPGAEEIAERLRKTLPPGIADDQTNQAIPPQAKAALDQMGKMVDALTEQLKHKTEQINTKAIELESHERIELAKIQAGIEIKMAELGSKESLQLLNHQIGQIEARMSLLRENVPLVSDDTPMDAPNQNLNQPTPAQAPAGNQPNPTGGTSPAPYVE